MGKKSKFVQICVEGATSDGRNVSRQDIQDMADTYDQRMYNARVNIEHFRGLLPNSPFKAYGDVTSVKAEDIKEGPLKGKLALLGQIDATDDLVEINRARQKVHTSIEYNPNFAKTGKAYLTGLAVTDSPASLGTEILQFCAGAASNPLAHRKSDPACLFTASEEITFEFEDAPEDKPNLLTRVKEMLSSRDKGHKDDMSDIQNTIILMTENQQQQSEKLGQIDTLTQAVTLLTENVEKQQNALTELTQKLSTTDADHLSRPPATGGKTELETDC
ncbi:GPO family capsid scaffolding protein [Enterobacter ludwigii]|uniref:GPO family capsid scaffolding protein n=1 Tax=Enterobacter ludwigii TaxID=299767 RepID=UPI001867C4C8|nr:GPO family capsid scaffolding protein [Enterobacter ludwigii]